MKIVWRSPARTLLFLMSFACASAAHAAPAARSAARDSASLDRSLAATTAVPWNPPDATARRTMWERVVLAPGRVASLPLSGLGLLTNRVLLYGEDTGRIPTSAAPNQAQIKSSGLTIGPPALGGRAGIGAAAQFRQPILDDRLRVDLVARYAGTLRNYNGTRLTAEGRPLALQYGVDWRPEEHFYGIGPQSASQNLSDYALHSEFLRATLSRERRPPSGEPLERTAVGIWTEARNDVLSPGREAGVVSTNVRFPELGPTTLGSRVEHLNYGTSFTIDRRSGNPHWSRGARLLVSAERHDDPVRALALRVGSPQGVAFNRYMIETETGFSFRRDPRTVRLYARVLNQSADASRMLPSDMATLGGPSGLSGFATGRFHDSDLLLTRASYIYPIGRRLEMDLHSEWGAVYPNVWTDATLRGLEHSVGTSMRVHFGVAPVARAGIDWSREGARLNFAVGGIQ